MCFYYYTIVETLDPEALKKSENKKPLEEPFLALDPCKTNLLELQQVSKEMSTKNKSYKILCRILPIYSQMKIEVLLPTSLSTKYFVESFQAKQMQQ